MTYLIVGVICCIVYGLWKVGGILIEEWQIENGIEDEEQAEYKGKALDEFWG